MQGRVHLYEGHSAADIVFGTRLMLTLGADTLLITNAAGGIDPAFSPGDLMLIEDHLNLTGDNCLVGDNDAALGPRFPDMTMAYDRALMSIADEVAAADGYALRRGVYAGLLGPTYETPAEVRMVRTLGGSAVGMSTVLEVIAARHMGARVLGVSCITNLAAGISKTLLSHDEVKETAERVRERFVGLLSGVLARVGPA
jgi:purine-nucleoside phosphorylase